MTPPATRAAHRPSRRHAVVNAAMDLFAAQPPDMVTVADIADRAGMTSAAVYYHFASKDAILYEGLNEFGNALVAHVTGLVENVAPEARLGALLIDVLQWIDRNAAAGSVYFISSVGVNSDVEALRRQHRADLIDQLSKATRRARGKLTAAEAAVIGVGLLSLLETAAASWLTKDATYQKLGHKAFLAEVSLLSDKVSGMSAV